MGVSFFFKRPVGSSVASNLEPKCPGWDILVNFCEHKTCNRKLYARVNKGCLKGDQKPFQQTHLMVGTSKASPSQGSPALTLKLGRCNRRQGPQHRHRLLD